MFGLSAGNITVAQIVEAALAANLSLSTVLESFEIGNEPDYWSYPGAPYLNGSTTFDASVYTAYQLNIVSELSKAGPSSGARCCFSSSPPSATSAATQSAGVLL